MRTRTGKEIPDREPKASHEKNKQKNIRVPHDAINEQVVIAAAIVDEQARKFLTTISADSFYGPGHDDIWRALQEMGRRKLDYSAATLRSIGGPGLDIEYVEELIKARPQAPHNLRHHVDTIAWDRVRIELASGPLVDLIDRLQDSKTDPQALRGLVKRMQDGLSGHGSQAYIRSGYDVAREQNNELTKRRTTQVASYGIGIPALDNYEGGHEMAGRPRLLPGTAPGMVTVITGRSGSGKSTTTATTVGGMVDQKRKVLWGCWEQGSGMSLEVLAAIRLGMPRRELTEGRFGAHEQRELNEEMERLAEFLVFYEFKREATRNRFMNERVLDTIQQVVSDSGCQVFIADLFRRALHETDPDAEEAALYRMQDIAKTTRSHVMMVQQQKTKGEEVRRDMRPTGSNIKGSTAWFEVADQIIGWHRPGQWKDIPDDTIEALVLKQRFGPWPLAVEIEWDGAYGFLGKGSSIPFPHEQNDDTLVNDGVDDFLDNGRSTTKKRRK